MSTPEHSLIGRFSDALWLEKGLVDNTHEAYRNDLQQSSVWLDGRGLRLEGIGHDAVLDHPTWRPEQGYKARSTACFLSGLCDFYHYCPRSDLIAEDPTLQVDLLQPDKPLSKPLSEADVETLPATPEVDDSLGLHDCIMLKVLHVYGLWVSELISLTLEQVSLRQGVVKVSDKGSKECPVPLSEEAISWLERYLREAHGDLLGGWPGDVLFPNPRDEQVTCQTFWHHIKHRVQVTAIGALILPYTPRHTFTIYLLNHGADLRMVQAPLGYSDLSTTQIYTYIARTRLQDPYVRHHPRG